MIQATTATNLTAYLQTADNRITTYPVTSIRHLVKFTNAMDKSVQFAYGATETINNRYTEFTFVHSTSPNVYTGRIDLTKAGYWKYEVFEVVWIKSESEGGGAGTPVLDAEKAPATDKDVVVHPTQAAGLVMGRVTKGKMYVAEKDGTEEVTYSQNGKSVQVLTIIEGGTGYTSAPTISITGGGSPITRAAATCTISGGEVNTVTITAPGNGYTSTPTVTLSGGGATLGARIVASIEETNYIYAG
tara:strand:- start:385 stop:1119 length:735 start_codon:yes stop_codon:yes gene_type:complete